jgi:hypothetical protein
VGATDASNAVRFVKRAGEPFVYGVDTNIESWVPASYLGLRSKALADVKVDDITKLVIEKKTGRVTLQRGADKKWQLVEPAHGVLDNDALQHLLDEFTAVRAEEFIHAGRDNLAEYGLDEPEVTFVVTAGDKTSTLALGKLTGGERKFALWGDPPLIFTLAMSGVNTLTKDVVMPSAPASSNAPPAAATQPTDGGIPPPATPPPTNSPTKS